MKKVLITKGLPGSGKTTFAKNTLIQEPFEYMRINKDELRTMLSFIAYTSKLENIVISTRDFLIKEILKKDCSVVVDDTNLNPTHIKRIKKLVGDEAEVSVIDFTNVPVEECIKRDKGRVKCVGEIVIRNMAEKYLTQPLPKAIICDLDGTLALLNGRDPYNASTCEQDILNTVVASVIKDKKVILVSGREDKYREQTMNFLSKYGIAYMELFMRKTKDNRKDTIVKKEIYDTYIKDKFHIEFVLDDRNSVVEMWRGIGLTCLQVAKGNF